jgi:hypothetical protein
MCVIYAVEAADFTLGAEMSAEIVSAAQETARRIVDELAV